MSPLIRYTIAVCTVLAVSAAADTAPWQLDLDANVTVTQNAYSQSWIGTEKGALSWASKLNFVAERQFTPLFNHRNTLKLAFGQTKTQKEDHSWGRFQKATDLVDFESLQRFTVNKNIEPFVAVRLISQFVDGTDSTQNHYLNPLSLFESFGIARTFVNNSAADWDGRFGGAVNQIITRYVHDETHTGSYTKTVNSAGLELVNELTAKMKDGLLDFSSQLTIYEALVSSEAEKTDETPQENFWRYPDVNWENILSVNLTRYVMVNMTVQILYDRELGEEARIKEVLALGLTYKFDNSDPAETKD